MQATSDIFLGWQQTTGPDGVDRDFYLRQLRDWKFSMPIEQMQPDGMGLYAGMSAWTLAWAHACSGDRVAIAAYLGKSDTFDMRSLTSPTPTPTRTNATTPNSPRLRSRGESKPFPVCERRSMST